MPPKYPGVSSGEPTGPGEPISIPEDTRTEDTSSEEYENSDGEDPSTGLDVDLKSTLPIPRKRKD